MASEREKIAVYGGDGRDAAKFGEQAVAYKSPKYGGNRDQKRLMAALKSGTICLVIILTRWNGHSATRTVCALCKRLGIPVVAKG